MAKRSRRARRQASQKQRYQQPTPQPTPAAEAPPVVEAPSPVVPKVETPSPASSSKTVDFAEEYYYVYEEVRNIVVIGSLMFVLLIGLGFVI